MSIEGAKGFLPSYCFQTTFYDTEMILSFECRYFVDAFLNTYLGQRFYFSDVEEEFSDLSRKALNGAYYGLMHRDMQSRNIMVKGGNFYFIDFQGARKGPVQYDLASLLIDPYVNLSAHLQKTLFDYAVKKISQRTIIDEEAFRSSYAYCRITRNLQMLGAFGFLTKIKNKLTFETYIPAAVKTLEQNLLGTKDTEFPKLKKMIEQISKLI